MAARPPRAAAALWAAAASLLVLLLRGTAGEEEEEGRSCAGSAGACGAEAERTAGLRVKIAEAPSADRNNGTQGATAVLSSDVFYGRPILRVPWRALLGPETLADEELRHELELLPSLLAAEGGPPGGSQEGDRRLLGLAYALISESRNPASIFREWLDALRPEPAPLALDLTERQLRALAGTTVEGVPEELERQRNLVERLSANLTSFRQRPVSRDESRWALSVLVRHAQHVTARRGDGQTLAPPRTLHLVPLPALLHAPRHADASVAGVLEETEAGLLQAARRDMRQGEEVFMWAGRFSNSELVLRLGTGLPRNPTGVGGNASPPPNWNPGASTPHNREYRRYNCTTSEVFEIRVSPKGWPGRAFVRCSRVAWFLANDWYKPEYVDRMHLLDKWPPPVKYNHSDWLGWTQADRAVNRALLDYCGRMKTRLKEAVTSAVAEDFRHSTDPVDVLLWRLRAEESKAFRECVTLAKSVSNTA